MDNFWAEALTSSGILNFLRVAIDAADARAFSLGGVALALIPLFQWPLMLCLLSFVFGLGMGSGQPIITMLTFQNSPPGRSGESVGLKVTANHVTNMVSPMIFGSIGTLAGLLPMFWANALLMVAGACLSRPKKT